MSSSVRTVTAPSFGSGRGSGGSGKRGRDGDDGRDRRRPDKPRPLDNFGLVDLGPDGRLRVMILLMLKVATSLLSVGRSQFSSFVLQHAQ